MSVSLEQLKRFKAHFDLARSAAELEFLQLQRHKCSNCGKNWRVKPPNTLIVCPCSYRAIQLLADNRDEIRGEPETIPVNSLYGITVILESDFDESTNNLLPTAGEEDAQDRPNQRGQKP